MFIRLGAVAHSETSNSYWSVEPWRHWRSWDRKWKNGRVLNSAACLDSYAPKDCQVRSQCISIQLTSVCRFAYGPADASATHYLLLQ